MMKTPHILILCLPSVMALMYNVWAADDSPCIYVQVEKCPNTSSVCKCVKVDDTSVVCCHITSEFQLKESLTCAGVNGRPDITALHIRNATLEKLDASSDKWRYLVSLSVTDSHVPRLVKRFGSEYKLTCLNLSNNGLSEVDPRVLMQLPKLSKLDLSFNNLTTLPDINVQMTHFFLDVAENPQLSCTSLQKVMGNISNSTYGIHFLHENSTYCLRPTSFHWFNSTEKIPFYQVQLFSKVDDECPKGDGYQCSCDIDRLNFYVTDFRYSVSVDCSNRKLTQLPKPLPPNTIQINVTNNNITSLDDLSVDPSYHSVTKFFADFNKITSINSLEGSKFLDNFVILSLVHNRIKSIPIYILNDALDRNQNTKAVLFGFNKFTCDCNTAQVLKFWLVANKNIIRDHDKILCENVPDKVIDLDQNKVCIYQRDWSDYIKYVIAAEILMFILLISKVSYDYWVFKTAGYLPWPASKMPKLPCDWVFE